jgi:hypothetical protein
MDTETLVANRIDDGRKLVEELLRQGFAVSAAFWLHASEDGKWYFYIVSPKVDTEGIIEAYRALHPVVRVMPPLFWIRPLEIKLIGPNNPIARDILAIQSRTTAPRGSPTRWGGTRLGNVSVEEAYLYPLPATTP